MKERRTFKYTLGLQTSIIYIGNNLLTKLPEEVKNITPGKQVVFLSDDMVYQLYGDNLRKGFEKQGYPVLTQYSSLVRVSILVNGESSWRKY